MRKKPAARKRTAKKKRAQIPPELIGTPVEALAKAALKAGAHLQFIHTPLNEVPEYFRPLIASNPPPEILKHLQDLAPIHRNLLERRKELDVKEKALAEKAEFLAKQSNELRRERFAAENGASVGEAYTPKELIGDKLLPKVADAVNHPAHYNAGKIEVIEFIEDQKLGYNLGNAIKYISRYGKKKVEKQAEDLAKARWYIKREMELLAARQAQREPVRPNEMTRN